MRSRPSRPAARAALAALVALAALAACGPGDPQAVSLAELAGAMEDYDGSVVETVGVVREFTQEEHDAVRDHFVIEDDEHNRVELVPHDVVAPYIDEHVRVIGQFTFAETQGRLIEVEEITPEERPADLAGP